MTLILMMLLKTESEITLPLKRRVRTRQSMRRPWRAADDLIVMHERSI
jgi:hypothetical protein